MKKVFAMLMVVTLFVATLAISVSADGYSGVSVQASSTTANIGDEVSVTAYIGDYSSTDGIMNVVFNMNASAGLEYVSSSVGGITGTGYMSGIFNAANGRFGGMGWLGTPYKGGSVDAVTVTYKVVAAGSHTVSISGATVTDAAYADVAVSGSSVTIKVPCTTHAWNAGSVTTAPSCETTGVKTFTCTVCGETTTETVPSLGGHKWDEGTVTTDPTCTEDGVKTFTCTNGCGQTKTEAVEATGHDWDEGTVTTDPTCTEPGVKTITCTNGCGETKTEAVPATGHTANGESTTIPATCTEDGKIIGGHCSVCGIALDEEIIPATGHAWDEGTVTTAPTCTEPGVKTFTCTNKCGETKTEAVPATDHAWDEGTVTTAPSCTEAGVMLYTCTNDSTHTRTEAIPALGHATPDWEVDEKEHKGTCPDCGEDLTADHDYHYVGVVDGKEEWKCECGEAIYKDLPANDADLDDVPKTGDISSQIVVFAACGLAALMAVAFVFKRKAA